MHVTTHSFYVHVAINESVLSFKKLMQGMAK